MSAPLCCGVFLLHKTFQRIFLTDTHRGYILTDRKDTPIGYERRFFMEKCHHCEACTKTKHRDDTEYKDLLNRLSRIEGQVRGVRKMVEEDAYCVDILTQVSAITSALNSFNKVLLGNHIRTCVADGIRNGDDEIVEELVKTTQKLMK